MDVEVLLSTMYQKDNTFLSHMNIESNCLAINQTDHNEEMHEENEKFKYRVISTLERGLSKSRNMAIGNSNGDICILADDDIEYVKGYSKIISNEFEKNPDYDILTFMVEGKDKEFKKYIKKERKLGYITSLKVSSVEIAFRLNSIKRNNIRFNEFLGTGSVFNMGEENAFLYECIRKGLKMKFIPIKIADIYVGNSTWFHGYSEKYFFNRGAAFTGMSRKAALLLIGQFTFRHYKDYKETVSMKDAFFYMLKGRKAYIKKMKGLK